MDLPGLGPSARAAVAATIATEAERLWPCVDPFVLGDIVDCAINHYGKYPYNHPHDGEWCSRRPWRRNFTPFPPMLAGSDGRPPGNAKPGGDVAGEGGTR